MTQQSRSPNNLSLFVGLWLGLTLVAGISVFALFFWVLSPRQSAAAPTVPVATIVPTVAVPTLAATPAPVTTSVYPACDYPPFPASGFGYGVQSHVFVGDNAYWLTMVRDKLHLQWVKMQVRWADLEQTPGQIYWDVLDGAVREACANGLRVMLSVVDAPEWTHANPLPAPEGQAAPPDDYQQYANFLAALIDRYAGRVQAIEVWNEANLEREWNTASGVNAQEYVKMLGVAYNTIKAKDPAIIVISGAPAPTGANIASDTGRPLVVDDATFLTQFVQAGGLNYADCIGTHSNGTNLPPDVDAYNPPGSADGKTFRGPWDGPHYSYSLRSQVETYAKILNGQKQQCVTEFGYASAINGQYRPGFEFAADVSEQQQAEYLVAAYNWMRQSGQVQMAFLFNLDYGPKGGDALSDDNVLFSLLNKEGAPRPAFDAISVMDKP